MKTILVVEDHDNTRHWWLTNLEGAFAEVAVDGVSTLGAARDRCAERPYDLILVDINLPDGSGLALVSETNAQYPETYMVISSIYDDDDHVFSAIRAGAMGYLVKDQQREQQIDQLKEIVNGKPPLSSSVARRILRYFVDEQGDAAKQQAEGNSSSLTAREAEVLSLIAKGYSRPEVARLLGLTLNTISGYTRVMYRKLHISRRAEAVMEAARLGLIKL